VISESPQFHRLAERSGEQLVITVDNRDVAVRQGDLIITAVLLHQKAIRRFEFGDGFRAGYCLMAACQDCWVSLGDGRRVRACDTIVEPGMEVRTGIFNANGKTENC
jgi:predicted molibdopterin-dependent oxidoreductase YjgC